MTSSIIWSTLSGRKPPKLPNWACWHKSSPAACFQSRYCQKLNLLCRWSSKPVSCHFWSRNISQQTISWLTTYLFHFCRTDWKIIWTGGSYWKQRSTSVILDKLSVDNRLRPNVSVLGLKSWYWGRTPYRSIWLYSWLSRLRCLC